MAEDNLARLADAELVEPSELDDDDKAKVAKLSGAEIDSLISIKEKLGSRGKLPRFGDTAFF